MLITLRDRLNTTIRTVNSILWIRYLASLEQIRRGGSSMRFRIRFHDQTNSLDLRYNTFDVMTEDYTRLTEAMRGH